MATPFTYMSKKHNRMIHIIVFNMRKFIEISYLNTQKVFDKTNKQMICISLTYHVFWEQVMQDQVSLGQTRRGQSCARSSPLSSPCTESDHIGEKGWQAQTHTDTAHRYTSQLQLLLELALFETSVNFATGTHT